MIVVFEKKNDRVRFEVLRASVTDERIMVKLFEKHGREIVKNFPLGVPLNLDVYKLKKLLEGRRKRSLTGAGNGRRR